MGLRGDAEISSSLPFVAFFDEAAIVGTGKPGCGEL